MNEAEADDGAVHRFWVFVGLRRAAGHVDDLEDLFTLLLLIVLFDQVADTIPEPV